MEAPSAAQMKIDDSDEATAVTSNSENASAAATPTDQTAGASNNTGNYSSEEKGKDCMEEEDVSSTDDDEEESSDADFSPKEDPELLLIKANALKEEGNNYFKEKEYEKASRSYRRGTNTLKPLNRGNTGDEQVKVLLVSLQTNLSMMCLKIGKPKQSVQVASAALEIDATNVKALYRRAVARRQIGDTDDAREDLRQALQQDPNNVAVKKELASLKKELEEAKKAQKKGLQKAFSKSGGGLGLLYEDKEQENRRKAEETKRKKEQEEELLKKRKSEWEDECVKRMAKGEPALSFDEWDRECKEKEKEEERRKKEERRKAREAAKQEVNNDSDDDELTEKELAQLRGYKKTADGRITSYFTREQSAHEMSLIGDIAPKRLEKSSESAPTSLPSSSDAGKGTTSAWNQAGTTWEEKNTTDWCRDRLEARLKETNVPVVDLTPVVTAVDNMTGEASVAIASGKKRYIFDFHCTVKFDVRDSDDVIASGSLRLPDICSTHHHELEVELGGWKKKPSSEHAQKATDCRASLVKCVRESVKRFVDDFNHHY